MFAGTATLTSLSSAVDESVLFRNFFACLATEVDCTTCASLSMLTTAVVLLPNRAWLLAALLVT